MSSEPLPFSVDLICRLTKELSDHLFVPEPYIAERCISCGSRNNRRPIGVRTHKENCKAIALIKESLEFVSKY